MPVDSLADLAALTRELRDVLLADLGDAESDSVWPGHAAWFTRRTGITGSLAFADAVAQAVTCGCFGLQICRTRLRETRAVAWLATHADPLLRDVLLLCDEELAPPKSASPVHDAAGQVRQFLGRDRAEVIACELPSSLADAPVYFYERFLSVYDASSRRGKGVFYTPRDLVDFVVASVDRLLRDEFQLADGIADEALWHDVVDPSRPRGTRDVLRNVSSPATQAIEPDGGAVEGPGSFVQILDPAMGTGTFLLATAALIHRRFRERIVGRERCELFAQQLWDQYVTDHLLPRLWGQEIMLAPLVLAHVAMVAWLAESGFRFERPGRLHFELANTMQQPQVGSGACAAEPGRFTVVLGNPPFSGISDNRQSWMRALLRGRAPQDDAPVANYFVAGGTALAEKKHWLEDDYVKFMRFAHWQIERAQCGIVAFVTNHAYLDNVTFRGMREQLLETFGRMTVVDLHGNARNGLRRGDGTSDQSVFGIEQGVAVSFLRRPVAATKLRSVSHAGLWGSAASKLATLQQHTVATLPQAEIEPRSPFFFLVPKDNRLLEQYEAGFRLCDIMPLNSTAVVTARDRFVVAFDAVELRRRMSEFADPHVSDDEIRRRYFGNTRSPKYSPGDTRSWRLAAARKRLQDAPHWQRYIQPCYYRPFDRRQIFWSPWMIDWPRTNVMEHLVAGRNLALVARRQMPTGQPCTHFWVTDEIAVDGLIRSDNRGSESVFPLHVFDMTTGESDRECDEMPVGTHAAPATKPNFSDAFIAHCEEKLGLVWSPMPREIVDDGLEGDAVEHEIVENGHLTPDAVFQYIYGLFHCPCYRQRFAEYLCVDFPRVVLPRRVELFRDMVSAGRELIALHLLRHDACLLPRLSQVGDKAFDQPVKIGAGYPKYRDQTVWLCREVGLSPVLKVVWEFRVGSYQVCRKWLKDRSGRVLSVAEIDQYRRIVEVIGRTIAVMDALDQQIARHGGWESAF